MTSSEQWSWKGAFARNRGLISESEQERLSLATVAIAGAGGVGGSHALTLARQGVGGFHLADSDTFSISNLNRQAGARVSTMGRNKAEEIAAQIRDINPAARIELWRENIGPLNIGAFLDGTDVVLDGVDFFAFGARRLLFSQARARGLWALTTAPLGFSVALLAFDPDGMAFERYCGFEPGMSQADEIVAFLAALAPFHTHAGYIDYGRADVGARTGPSSIIACQLCSSVIAMETISLLLGRRAPAAAPQVMQFDPYQRVYRQGTIWGGGRNLLQGVKRWVIRRKLEALGVFAQTQAHGSTS